MDRVWPAAASLPGLPRYRHGTKSMDVLVWPLMSWFGLGLTDSFRQAGRDSADLRQILERLSIDGEMWLETIGSFGRQFHGAVGRVSSMAARASRSGKLWFQGASFSRLAFE
jgi:hypothetical protein